ncbi:helix-turn-helix domain-containing protein [Paenibacillus sp. WLX1005]|uniref:helix-turn-helix domain-containing protein n=1 Tax=Paenibacillus sp. WLX1005 TaxID=3243766 RepID=UPI003984353D
MCATSFAIDNGSRRELTLHRTTTLPLACYETHIRQHAQGYIPLHWHDELQFVLITHGEALFQVQDQQVHVREGEGLFINSGCLHMAEAVRGYECTYICLNVAPHFVTTQELYISCVQPYIQATNVPYMLIDPQQTWGHCIKQAIRRIRQCLQERPALFEMELAVQLTSIWKSLISHGFQPEYSPAEMIKSQRIKQMLHWIHQHYADRITLDEIASVGSLSRSECCRYFRRFLKTTPLNYVADYRIQQSLILLQSESSVTEAAYQVGFNSTSYFIERFRNVMQMTPLAYKKSKRWHAPSN